MTENNGMLVDNARNQYISRLVKSCMYTIKYTTLYYNKINVFTFKFVVVVFPLLYN